jgi:hypothetical protein
MLNECAKSEVRLSLENWSARKYWKSFVKDPVY